MIVELPVTIEAPDIAATDCPLRVTFSDGTSRLLLVEGAAWRQVIALLGDILDSTKAASLDVVTSGTIPISGKTVGEK